MKRRTHRLIAVPAFVAGMLAYAVFPSGSDAEALGPCGSDGLRAYADQSSTTDSNFQTASGVATVDATCTVHLSGTATDGLPGLTRATARVTTHARVVRVDNLTPGMYRYRFVFEIDEVYGNHRSTYLTDSGQIIPSVDASVVFGPGTRVGFASVGEPKEKRYELVVDARVNKADDVHAYIDFNDRLLHRGGNAEFRLDARVLSINVERIGNL